LLQTNATPQPYAYVCDAVIQQDTTINVTEALARGPGLSPIAWQAMYDLSDEVARGARVEWYAIYNGDPESGRMGYRPSQAEEVMVPAAPAEREVRENKHICACGGDRRLTSSQKAKGGRLRAIKSLFFR